MSTRTVESKDALALGLAFIEAHPEAWNQNCWDGCLGYWTAKYSSEVTSIQPSIAGPTLHLRNGTALTLQAWLWSRFGQDASILWCGDRTLVQLRAGVKAYIEDRSVHDAVIETITFAVALETQQRARQAANDLLRV